MIKFSNLGIKEIKNGNNSVIKAYLGNDIVFQKDNWHLVEQRYAPDLNSNSWRKELFEGMKITLHADINEGIGVRVQLFQDGERIDMAYINNEDGYSFYRDTPYTVYTRRPKHNTFSVEGKKAYKKLHLKYGVSDVYIIIDSFGSNNLTYVYEPKGQWEV